MRLYFAFLAGLIIVTSASAGTIAISEVKSDGASNILILLSDSKYPGDCGTISNANTASLQLVSEISSAPQQSFLACWFRNGPEKVRIHFWDPRSGEKGKLDMSLTSFDKTRRLKNWDDAPIMPNPIP